VSILRRKRVVVTRSDEQADDLCSKLEAMGGVPVRCPTIRIGPPSSWDPVEAALRGLEGYDWLVLTSANGVRSLLVGLGRRGIGAGRLAATRVAAVGRVTAAVLAGHGLAVAYVPEAEGSRSLAETLPDVAGRRILVAQGEKADPILATVLRSRGAREVDTLTVYRTVPVPPTGAALEELRRGVDAITFTSPSTVTGFVGLGPEWRKIAEGVIVASIGPTTSAAARACGLEVHAEASERTMGALVDAVARGFAREESSRG
jgi:uroporphyrinogen III methyltransferase/synthase